MINKVILVGRLGADPETRYTQANVAVCTFSVATSDRYKKDGEYVQNTEWHKIVTFGNTAEYCQQYITKGQLVYIEGSVSTSKWTDSDGVVRYTTNIKTNKIKLLDSIKSSSDNTPADDDDDPNDKDSKLPF